MSKCRRCHQEVDKYATIFGYCFKCAKVLGARIREEDLLTPEKVHKMVFLLREFFKLLDTKEESDSGKVFSPTYISTCRVMHSKKLKAILPQLRELIKWNLKS